MNIEEIRDYSLSLKAVTEGFPFDETTLVFKVMNKMFCLLSLNKIQVNLKNDPEKNIELRANYQAIIPGYHMNKEHWNTVDLNGTVPPDLIKELIAESYRLIINSLPKKKQEEFRNL